MSAERATMAGRVPEAHSLSQQAQIHPEDLTTEAWASEARRLGVNSILVGQIGEPRPLGKARLATYNLPRNKGTSRPFSTHWWRPGKMMREVRDEKANRYLVNLIPPANSELKRDRRRDINSWQVRFFLLQNLRLLMHEYTLSIDAIRPSKDTLYSGDITVDSKGNILMGMGLKNSQGEVALGLKNSDYIAQTDDQGILRYSIGQEVIEDRKKVLRHYVPSAQADTPENQAIRTTMHSVLQQLQKIVPARQEQTEGENEENIAYPAPAIFHAQEQLTNIHPGYYEFTLSVDGELRFYDMKDNPAFRRLRDTSEQQLEKMERENLLSVSVE